LQNNTKQPLIGHSITVLPVVDSSNNYAMEQLYDGKAAHGQAFMALTQTNGKGQMGKQWKTGQNENLALSIVIEPIGVNLNQQFLLQTFITVSIVQWLNTKKDGFCIKWPNDIYYNDRKAAGILIENAINGTNWNYAIIGIGLNVNQKEFDTSVPNAISLQQIIGENIDLYLLANELCVALEQQWLLFKQKPTSFLELYQQYLYKKNELVKFRQGNKVFITIVKSVTAQGDLLCGDNEEFSFRHGEVEWVK
jgi:BirA family biotin operon repressor/biotin-[acetyl-CoA-carboxylase] ligase